MRPLRTGPLMLLAARRGRKRALEARKNPNARDDTFVRLIFNGDLGAGAGLDASVLDDAAVCIPHRHGALHRVASAIAAADPSQRNRTATSDAINTVRNRSASGALFNVLIEHHEDVAAPSPRSTSPFIAPALLDAELRRDLESGRESVDSTISRCISIVSRRVRPDRPQA